jgi:hypothetical protein
LLPERVDDERSALRRRLGVDLGGAGERGLQALGAGLGHVARLLTEDDAEDEDREHRNRQPHGDATLEAAPAARSRRRRVAAAAEADDDRHQGDVDRERNQARDDEHHPVDR